jgi:TRAP-type C4-dicarboxylate transport system substrate-binding protein
MTGDSSFGGGIVMKKLILLSTAFVVFTGMLTFIGVSPVSSETVELKLAHFMPTMHVQHRKAFEPFAKKVAEASGGKVTIKIFPGATLGNPKTMVDAIKTGITDIGFVLPSYVPGRFQRSSVFDLPYIFNGAVNMTNVMYDQYEKNFAPDYKQFKVLWFLAAPLSQVFTVDKPIATAADFKGMKIRSGNSLESESLKKWGASPVGMPVSELSVSMQKGVVDGALTAYSALKSHKLIDVIHHMTELNFSGALMVVLMNKKKWDSLSDEARAAIDSVATKEFGLMAAKAFDDEDEEILALAKSKGIEFHQLPPAEKEILRLAVEDNWNEWVNKHSKKGIDGQQILDDTVAAAKKF